MSAPVPPPRETGLWLLTTQQRCIRVWKYMYNLAMLTAVNAGGGYIYIYRMIHVAPNTYLGECFGRFFDFDREFLHTTSFMCPYCEDSTCCFFFFIRLIFRQLRLFGKCGPPQPNLFRRHTKTAKKTAGQAPEWYNGNVEHVCQTLGCISQNGGDILTFLRKMSKIRCFL